MHYILEGKTPVRVFDFMEWAIAFQNMNIVVESTMIGDVHVSTVFLGVDHNFGRQPLILFETMIFGGEHDRYCERYSTWDEAVAGHHEACALVLS